ncbi:hypothetical protein MRB53_010319 [Persea americana]|uniref:Uncharacterized protein n=1 Tax=Persea americana TaxID=3435 RepID=A0ACC2LRM2_PERAE|nr:hypothetical protein MRB53_010319 [Persea americana]
MVVALGPGKFYGRSLPRPRYYTDVKFNEERVDPPLLVFEPFLFWANDAHWSMGGLSFQRHRLQGKIEGNINKLRAQREDNASSSSSNINNRFIIQLNQQNPPPPQKFAVLRDDPEEEEEEEDGEIYVAPVQRKRARKLIDEFNKVGSSLLREEPVKPKKQSEDLVSKKKGKIVMETVASRTRSSSRLEKGKDKEQERAPKERKKRTEAKKFY